MMCTIEWVVLADVVDTVETEILYKGVLSKMVEFRTVKLYFEEVELYILWRIPV